MTPMTETAELKREIRWLQDQARAADGLAESVADIRATVDIISEQIADTDRVINSHADVLHRLVDQIAENSDFLNRLCDNYNKMVEVLNRLIRPPPPPPPPPPKAASKAKPKRQTTFTIEHNIPMPAADNAVKKKSRNKHGGSTTTDYWTIARPSKT
jgi:hypothetical protein